MKITPDFWDGLAGKYAAQPVEDPVAYEYKLAKTRELLTPDMEILEVACGTGTTALTHAPHVKSIHAIDFSPEMIGIARAKAAEQGVTNVTFSIKAIADLPAEDRYDMVQAHSILHLLPDHRSTLIKLYGLTRPGGWFISSTACMSDLSPLFRIALPIARSLGKAPFVRFFSGDQIVADIRQAGFEISSQWRPGPKAAMFVIARRPA